MMSFTPLLRLLFAFLLLMMVLPFGCGDDDDDDDSAAETPSDDDDDDAVDDDDDSSDDDDDDDDMPFKVKVEYVKVPAPAAPPNPVTGAETPDHYNNVMVLRFRQDMGDQPPRPVKGIIMFFTGWGAGASQFTFVGTDMVTRANGDIEVWVLDRRTNLLEDMWGMNAAELYKDPRLAYDYYFNNIPVLGRTFPGFYGPKDPDMEMLSEWGMELFLGAVRNVIEYIPEANRATNMFIGGHSQGARSARAYAAYEFDDGHMGKDDLAGLILYDGLDEAGSMETTEDDYLALVQGIRDGTLNYYESNFYMSDVTMVYLLQYLAMCSTEGFGVGDPEMGPDGHLNDWGTFSAIIPFMTRFRDVTLTNEAMIGLLIDDESGPLQSSFSIHGGRLTGGEIGHDMIGDFPAENGASYSWLNYNEVQPEELSDIQKMIRMIYEGPTNFTDSYNSNRLLQEHIAAGNMESEGTWLHNYFHYYTSRVDIPVVAVRSKHVLEQPADVYANYMSMLPPVAGQTLPRDQFGFDIIEVNDWSHMEPLLVEPDRNPVYDGIIEWVGQMSEGEVQVPEFGTPFYDEEPFPGR